MRAGRLRLEPAVRLDAYALDGASTVVPSPRLGLTLRPLAWDGLRLKALAARAFRYPTFNERYYEPGGNPDLDPEDGWTAEAGIHTRIQRPAWRVDAEVTAYRMHLTDQIVWRPSFVQSGLKVWQPKNVAQVRTRGLETSLRGQAQLASPVRVRGGASFTHTRAENRSNPTSPEFGAQLPYVPRQQVKSWMGVDAGPVSLDATLRLVGSRYYTSDASQAVPPYQVLDLQAGAEWSVRGATIHARLRLDNALDERYAVVRLYPMPPRHLSARLTVSLAP
jgi:iron complex outermembrane receptor protein